MIQPLHQTFLPPPMVLLCALFLSPSASNETTNESTDIGYHAHGDRFTVYPDPIRYQEETGQQREVWIRALHLCTPVSTDSDLTTECISALGEYFVDEPTWDYSRPVRYYTAFGGEWADKSINPRYWNVLGVPFGYDDYMMEEIPRWRDVFD